MIRIERRLLVVHAHPDNESITTGGLLARCANENVQTCLVMCTDGRYGPVNPELGLILTPGELAKIRADELKTSATLLGVSEIRQLDYHDSGMTDSEYNLAPRAFWSQHIHKVVGEMVSIVREFRPHVVVSYDSFGCTGHPDHIQAHRVTLLAVEAAVETHAFPHTGMTWQVSQFFYPVFPVSVMEQFIQTELQNGNPHPFDGRSAVDINYTRPDYHVTHKVDIRQVYERKRDALYAHRTQVGLHYPQMYRAALARDQYEHFRLAFSRTDISEFDDIFELV